MGRSVHEVGTRKEQQRSARVRFVEIAADMEMGYYVDSEGHQWDARAFLIGQIMRHMGYAENNLSRAIYPAWWPGQDAMRRMVALKVMLRGAQARAGSGGHPWLDPLLAAAVEEVLFRLYSDPAAVGLRELVELTTKLARLQDEQRRGGAFAAPAAALAREGVAIQRVTETILQLPPEEQERARRALDAVSARMRDALPEPIA